jgi:hypothetical protein
MKLLRAPHCIPEEVPRYSLEEVDRDWPTSVDNCHGRLCRTLSNPDTSLLFSALNVAKLRFWQGCPDHNPRKTRNYFPVCYPGIRSRPASRTLTFAPCCLNSRIRVSVDGETHVACARRLCVLQGGIGLGLEQGELDAVFTPLGNRV